MPSVAITGVSGALGRRIVAAMAGPGGWDIVGIDRLAFPAAVAKPRRFVVHQADLRSVDLRSVFRGVDAVVHLATADQRAAESGQQDDALIAARVLEAAAAVGAAAVVVLSSAAVYGAYADNPVPLTEEAPVRPNAGFRYGEDRASVERLTATWREAHADVAVAVLRSAPVLGLAHKMSWLARTVRPSLPDRLALPLPSMQFVHVDDVAGAVIHALQRRLDGTFNVASADWIGGDEAPDLLGPAFRLPLPPRLVGALNRVVDARPGAARPAGALAYSRAPWVVAVDRLQATGWAPRSTSAEAFVASQRPSGPARFFARHRQEVTLAGVGLVASSGLGGLGVLLRRARRVRRGG